MPRMISSQISGICSTIEKTELKAVHAISRMTPAQVNAARQKNLADHILLLKQTYSEPERQGAVALLEDLLAARIKEAEKNGFLATERKNAPKT